MNPIVQFVKELQVDCGLILKEHDKNQDVKNMRIASVVFRVLGIFMLCYVPFAFVTGAISVAKATTYFGVRLALISWVSSTLLGIPLAHDLIVMGRNQSRLLAHTHNPRPADESIVSRLIGGVSSGIEVVKTVGKEINRDTPFMIHDTIIFEPLYTVVASHIRQKQLEEVNRQLAQQTG
ncbi:MAG: hypothetical protein JWO53_1304 [Chlamydiia bacterium]|nr:hypothetical protein [Chlamydiia bacterium]